MLFKLKIFAFLFDVPVVSSYFTRFVCFNFLQEIKKRLQLLLIRKSVLKVFLFEIILIFLNSD